MFLVEVKVTETVLLSLGERISFTEVGVQVILVLAGAATGVGTRLAVLAEVEGPTAVPPWLGADCCENK